MAQSHRTVATTKTRRHEDTKDTQRTVGEGLIPSRVHHGSAVVIPIDHRHGASVWDDDALIHVILSERVRE